MEQNTAQTEKGTHCENFLKTNHALKYMLDVFGSINIYWPVGGREGGKYKMQMRATFKLYFSSSQISGWIPSPCTSLCQTSIVSNKCLFQSISIMWSIIFIVYIFIYVFSISCQSLYNCKVVLPGTLPGIEGGLYS